MKKLIILFCLLTLKLNAQSNLKFNRRYVECEDQWVAFKMNEDSSYIFGFIYIDEQAGLTFNHEGSFRYNADQTIQVKKLTGSTIKMRLQANSVKVAIIPELMYGDLKIQAIPDWLHFYQTDTVSIKRLYKWGFMYNGWNECSKALTYLLKAKKLQPNYEGLNVELAYSYNCLGEYDSAEIILEDDIKMNPSNAYVNKEYIYTLVKSKKIDKAIQQYKSSLVVLKDESFNAENCYNILQYYYLHNDKENFKIWSKELKKWRIENEQIKQGVKQMKKEMSN